MVVKVIFIENKYKQQITQALGNMFKTSYFTPENVIISIKDFGHGRKSRIFRDYNMGHHFINKAKKIKNKNSLEEYEKLNKNNRFYLSSAFNDTWCCSFMKSLITEAEKDTKEKTGLYANSLPPEIMNKFLKNKKRQEELDGIERHICLFPYSLHD